MKRSRNAGMDHGARAGMLSKRDFLRLTVAGLGAAVAGLHTSRLLAKNLSAMEPSTATKPGGLGKYSKESPYYLVTPKGVRCQICPNQCVLQEGLESICRTKTVHGNKLYTVAYGNPCSVHVDPIEKKPVFHFLPASRSFSIATAGCNLSCMNCQNWEISQKSPKETQNYELFPAEVVAEAAKNGCKTIAFTYSEPTAFYEYMYDTAKLARAGGIRTLLISNGYINAKPLRDLAKYIDAANINLKSFREEIYATLNGGSLQPVLNTLKILKEEGVWLEITNLIVPTWTDKMDMIAEMCEWLVKNGFAETPLHFSRFFPLYKLTSLPYTPEATLEKAYHIAEKAGIKYIYIGNIPDTPHENTLCPSCKKVVLERRGFYIAANNINDGKCKFCGTRIAGVWS
jgi:pyruvate formate lyase activating enzyme